ncbi:Cationic amino acid transporter 5 [Morella rubra]|uniref:Cationic amino acid transporter 5 n=1 Tax=Morella rubra TaxID=262757 RepID=A0A6A1W8H1_9ROSI|nr:Cationic amino acid transporter 5 [Morella rubra]
MSLSALLQDLLPRASKVYALVLEKKRVKTLRAPAMESSQDRLISRSNDAEEIEELRKQRFAHAKTSNLTPFLPYGAKGIFQAAAIVHFAYGGFDNIATMAEETKNPSRDIPLGLLGSMSIITVIYCLMALALAMMQKYTDIDREAPYSLAFQSVGMKWAKYLVALGALKGMTTVLLVGALGQARYVTHIARAHMIPPWFALVHPKTGTPINATLLITISSACIAFFSSLDVLAGLLSVSTLFIFTMMPVALLARRYYVREITPRINLLKLVIFLLIILPPQWQLQHAED